MTEPRAAVPYAEILAAAVNAAEAAGLLPRRGVRATRIRMLVTDPATGEAVFRRRVPDKALRRRRQGTGRQYVTDQGYRVVTRAGHPLADSSGRVYEHREVLYGALGEGPHKCHWCGRGLAWKRRSGFARLVTDHLNDNRTDNRIENLVPSCTNCNSDRARRPDFFTHCPNGHARTPENIYERPDGNGGRQCRDCRRRSNRAQHVARKAKRLAREAEAS
jgi:hypothetical protein